jgi:acetyltransferase
MGIVNGHSGMVASFMIPGTWKGNLQSGGVSVIVQSGMLSTSFLMHIIGEGYFGLSKACSIGNRCDVNECDLLEYMGQDPTTEVVALYLESLIDVPRFRKAIMNLKRPVILIKGGTSAEGARAAKSHTASLAGNAQVAEGFFQQLGIYRARDFIEMMDLTRALVLWRGRKGGKRVAIVTFSGAAGIVASDHLVEQGMTLATLSPETVEKLKTVYPPWMEPENPVDIWPAVERNGRRSQGVAFEALLNDPQVDAIFFHIYVDSLIMRVGLDFMEPLKGSTKPVVIWVIGDQGFFRELRDYGESMGIPVYREIERGARALSLMLK